MRRGEEARSRRRLRNRGAVSRARFSSCAYIVSSLCPEVIVGLGKKPVAGLELYSTDAPEFGDQHGRRDHLFLWRDTDRTVRELEATGGRNAAGLVEFGARLGLFGEIMRPFVLSPPPALSEVVATFERIGRVELFHEFATLSIADLLDRYFDSETLKGALMFSALVSTVAGPCSPGTAYEFSHHSWGEFEGHFGRFGYAVGGMGAVAEALAASARAAGAEIMVNAGVRRILTQNHAVVGVELDDGTVLQSSIVISNADPRTTLQALVDPDELPPEARRQVGRIDIRGSMGHVPLLDRSSTRVRGPSPRSRAPTRRVYTVRRHPVGSSSGAGRHNSRAAWWRRTRLSCSYHRCPDPTLAAPGLHTMTTGARQLPLSTRRVAGTLGVTSSSRASSGRSRLSLLGSSRVSERRWLLLRWTYNAPTGSQRATSSRRLFEPALRVPRWLGPPGTGHQYMGSSCAERGCTRVEPSWALQGTTRHDIDKEWRRRGPFLKRAERPSWLRCRFTGRPLRSYSMATRNSM